MALENDKEAIGSQADTSSDRSEPTDRHERPERAERIDDRHNRLGRPGKDRDVRSAIKDAVKKVAATAEKDDDDQPAKSAGAVKDTTDSTKDRGTKDASPSTKEIPPATKTGETVPAAAPQAPATVAPPATAPKEVAAIWDKLPQEAQAIFAKREADMLKGVEQIKAKLKPLEDAFAPVRSQLQQLGKTEAEAASQLIGWQAALADPRRQAEAFRALAKAHNFDLQTLLAPQGAQGSQLNPNPDPTQAFRQYLDPVTQKVSQLETELERRDRERVQNDIATLSKDKPHFEKVRAAMGLLMQNGLVRGDSPKEAFDSAYEMACRADPEIFATIQQEAEAKREADAKAAQEAAAAKAAEAAEALRKKQAEEVAKAKRAAVGPRSGSPAGMAIAAASKGKSVRSTITDAMQERRGQV